MAQGKRTLPMAVFVSSSCLFVFRAIILRMFLQGAVAKGGAQSLSCKSKHRQFVWAWADLSKCRRLCRSTQFFFLLLRPPASKPPAKAQAPAQLQAPLKPGQPTPTPPAVAPKSGTEM